MEVILKANIEKLGVVGDLINVADGYARNYLIPRKLAIEATDKNRRFLEHEKKVEADRAAKHAKDAEKIAEQLSGVSCTITVQAGENDRLFGSVTNIDIANALAEQGFSVDRKNIILEEPIKELGIFTVPVKIYHEIFANIKVWIVKAQDN